jgi:hypothetical protein
MTDESWARAIERELGEKTAEAAALKSDVARIAGEMEKGFSRLEDAQVRAIGGLRAELKTQRDEDMETIGRQFEAINKQFQDQADQQSANRRLLLRVGWSIATLATLLAAASTGAQVALTEPRVAAAASALREAIGP